LSFNWVVLDSFSNSLNRHVFGDFVVLDLRDVFSLVLDGVIVGVLTLMRDRYALSDFLVFHH